MSETEFASEYNNWCLLGGSKGTDVTYDRITPFLSAERCRIAEELSRHPDVEDLKKELSILERFQDLNTAEGRTIAGKFLWRKFDLAHQATRKSEIDLTPDIMGYNNYDPGNDLMVLNASFRALIAIGQFRFWY